MQGKGVFLREAIDGPVCDLGGSLVGVCVLCVSFPLIFIRPRTMGTSGRPGACSAVFAVLAAFPVVFVVSAEFPVVIAVLPAVFAVLAAFPAFPAFPASCRASPATPRCNTLPFYPAPRSPRGSLSHHTPL